MPCLLHVNEIFNLLFHLSCVLKHLQKFFEQIFSFQAINSLMQRESFQDLQFKLVPTDCCGAENYQTGQLTFPTNGN